MAGVTSFPHDLEVVRQAASARTELISADRIAAHLRVVQASFAGVITGFIKERYARAHEIDLVAEVAGATWQPLSLRQWRTGDVTAAQATWMRSPRRV